MDEPPAPKSENIDVVVAKKKMTSATTETKSSSHTYIDPPLFSFSVSNPVNYLRKWWRRVISREGIDLRLRIHPVTAFVIIVMIGGAGFGVGRFSVPAPVAQFIPQWALKPEPTPDPWRETAFSGVLQKNAADRFYLVTNTEAEAVTLEVPYTINLSQYIGKRIFASGKYNSTTGVLVVSDATQMEVLLRVAPVIESSPVPTPSSEPPATLEPFPSPVPTQVP